MLMKGNLLVDWVSLNTSRVESLLIISREKTDWQPRKLFHSSPQSVPERLMKICQIKMFSQQLGRVNELIHSTRSHKPAHARVLPQSLEICCLREEWANFCFCNILSCYCHIYLRITFGRRRSARAHVDSPVCLVYHQKHYHCESEETVLRHKIFSYQIFDAHILLLHFTVEWRWLKQFFLAAWTQKPQKQMKVKFLNYFIFICCPIKSWNNFFVCRFFFGT